MGRRETRTWPCKGQARPLRLSREVEKKREGPVPTLVPSSTRTAALAMAALKTCSRGDPTVSSSCCCNQLFTLETRTRHSALENRACLWALPFSLEVHPLPSTHPARSLGRRQGGLGLDRGQAAWGITAQGLSSLQVRGVCPSVMATESKQVPGGPLQLTGCLCRNCLTAKPDSLE